MSYCFLTLNDFLCNFYQGDAFLISAGFWRYGPDYPPLLITAYDYPFVAGWRKLYCKLERNSFCTYIIIEMLGSTQTMPTDNFDITTYYKKKYCITILYKLILFLMIGIFSLVNLLIKPNAEQNEINQNYKGDERTQPSSHHSSVTISVSHHKFFLD